jgi:urease accessory protein
MTRWRSIAALSALATMIPGAAGALAPAHVPIGGAGLYAGLLHPLVVPEHVLALIGLGLLIGQQDQGRNALSAVFAAGLVAGLAAIALAAGPSHANDLLIACAAGTGLLVALARSIPAVVSWPLAAAVGTAIGLDSPPEVVDLRTAAAMLIGTLFGAIIVVAVIVELVAWLRRDWQRIGVRIAGSWTAAAGILVLALRLAT